MDYKVFPVDREVSSEETDLKRQVIYAIEEMFKNVR